jgi:hypothetical protein
LRHNAVILRAQRVIISGQDRNVPAKQANRLPPGFNSDARTWRSSASCFSSLIPRRRALARALDQRTDRGSGQSRAGRPALGHHGGPTGRDRGTIDADRGWCGFHWWGMYRLGGGSGTRPATRRHRVRVGWLPPLWVGSGGSDNADGRHNDSEHPDSPALLAGNATAQVAARQRTIKVTSPSLP